MSLSLPLVSVSRDGPVLGRCNYITGFLKTNEERGEVLTLMEVGQERKATLEWGWAA